MLFAPSDPSFSVRRLEVRSLVSLSNMHTVAIWYEQCSFFG